MKKTITLIALIISFLSYAQRPDGPPPPYEMGKQSKKIIAAKISFITNEIDLTPQEAEKFWPIYNEFDKKSRTLRREMHRIIKNIMNDKNGIENISDKKAEEILEKIESNKETIYTLEKRFNTDLLTVVSAKKILKLHHAEEEFKRKLLYKLRDHKRK